jgi:hypothetical protein
MAGQDRPGADQPENPLLTPEKRRLRCEVRELRDRSDRLIEELMRLSRPKELRQMFPPPSERP